MTIADPTDRPNEVRYRCVIDHFVVSLCYSDYAIVFHLGGVCHTTVSEFFVFSLYIRVIVQM